MEKKRDIFDLANKVGIIMNNHKSIEISKLFIKFYERMILIKDIINRYSKNKDSEKNILFSNSVVLLEKQCEYLYKSILICVSGNYKKIISQKVEAMSISEEYKEFVKDFLLKLLNNNKIVDLAYLLPLLENVEILKQSKSIIKEYIPGITTMAGAEIKVYYEKGLIKGEEKMVLDIGRFVITMWSKANLKLQRECLEHELTHMIVQPPICKVGENTNKLMEEEVENYLASISGKDNITLPNKDNITLPNIIAELEENGFVILKLDDELIAFCEERNILFFANDIKNLLNNYESDSFSFYQQPYISSDGKVWIGFRSHLKDCVKEKVDFPPFGENCYLWMYNPSYARKSGRESNSFLTSMEKIARYPEIYNAVGLENQELIDSISTNTGLSSKK